MAKVLTIKSSPRAGGNSDVLVDHAVTGAREAGHDVTTLILRDLEISGCTGCGSCAKTGTCVIPDDMQSVYPLLEENEHVILGSPIFFMGLPSQLKAMIDRCQVYWSRVYVLKTGTGRAHPGGNFLPLQIGGTKFKTVFKASKLVFRAWYSLLDLVPHSGVRLRAVDAVGDILDHPDALQKAHDLGRLVAEIHSG